MDYRGVETTAEYVARFETGADWRAEIETLARDCGIDAGWFVGLGAVQDATVFYYDQKEQTYLSQTFEEPLEVAACIGNVSILDGEQFAHTHAVLSREDGSTIAGHLDAATVFAGELYMRALDAELEREYDDQTGLDCWL